MKHVIVGSGPAGLAAARTLRQVAPRDQVTIVAEEPQPFYSKVLTSYFIAGKLSLDRLLLASIEDIRSQGIELLAGTRALRVDPNNKELTLSDNHRIDYDRLLLASGAGPAIPPLEGAELPGLFTLWTHDDALRLSRWIEAGQRAVVMGAGLVGLKVAESLLVRGLSVTVVELLDRVLPQLLADDDAAIVRKALEGRGIQIRTASSVMQLSGAGHIQQLHLGDGKVMDCDLVVVATGVRPNLSLARTAGLSLGRGILVNDFMETSVSHIFAAGDVAEGWDLARGRKLPNPTWANASEQGRIAAYNMAGQPRPFGGAVSMNSFTFLGFTMAAVGITQPEGDYVTVESHTDPRTGDYRKLIMLGNRVVGGVAIGDVRMVGLWRGLIGRKAGATTLGAALLSGKTTFAKTHNLV